MNNYREHRPWVGIGCMVFGLILLIGSDALAKTLVARYPVMQVVGLRGAFVVSLIILAAMFRGKTRRLVPHRLSPHLLRGFFAVLSTYLFIFGLSFVSLVNASAAAYTGPIFLTALAPFLLGERVGWFRWSAVLVGFIGTLIMLRPSGDGLDWPMLLPAAAALFGALRDIVTRKINVSEESMSILLTSNILLALVGLIGCLFAWHPISGRDIFLLLSSGALITVAHFLHIEAFRFAEAATIAPYRYTSILWAAALGYLVWGDRPDIYILIGGGIVIASGLVIFYRERKMSS